MFSIIVAVLFVINIYSNSVHTLPQRNKFGQSTFCWIFAVYWSAETLFVQPQLFLRMNKARRPCNKGRPTFRTSDSFETAAYSFSVLVLLATPISVSG